MIKVMIVFTLITFVEYSFTVYFNDLLGRSFLSPPVDKSRLAGISGKEAFLMIEVNHKT